MRLSVSSEIMQTFASTSGRTELHQPFASSFASSSALCFAVLRDDWLDVKGVALQTMIMQRMIQIMMQSMMQRMMHQGRIGRDGDLDLLAIRSTHN